MKLPVSWLKEYVDIDLPLEELARTLTMIGLEVEEVQVFGLPMPESEHHDLKITGLTWEPDKLVVAQIDEVLPHPNADRLVLCRLNDGQQEHIVLTGAPNLYPYKGTGPLAQPIKVAYAKEGARIYDGHQPGQVLTTLKRAKIRGIESYSMVCSEKELGLSDEHEGVIFFDADAPTGMPLADYIGDAVLEIGILPNMIRNASVIGIARELAAVTGKTLRRPQTTLPAGGAPIAGQAAIQITDPGLNPRFVLGLLRGVQVGPSPYKTQLRLRLAGMRPINNIVDATNYVMLETGQPLHAFDYDVLVQRAGGKAPTIITRAASPGEKLTTLDGVERTLEDFNILVCDTAGPLSLAGVMGGQESEVTRDTRTVLLEGASWNFINVRRTAFTQHLSSEAGYRFSRGIHPALARPAVELCLERMAQWSGGQPAAGLVDAYPQPPVDPQITLTERDIRRLLGITISAAEAAALLERLEFTCTVQGDTLTAQTPPHRLDIGEGMTGKADLLEELARMYGYNRIPTTRMAESLPRAKSSPALEMEARLRQILVRLGLQEVINYRLTSPEREARLLPAGSPVQELNYVRIKNPLTPERCVMRRSMLASVLDLLEKNVRLRERLAFFELGPVFLPRPDSVLPDEPQRLALALTGLRLPSTWDRTDAARLDFFDLKGILEALLEEMHASSISFVPAGHSSFHPGKCAEIRSGDLRLGVMGELHPLVKANYDFLAAPVLAAELDLDALQQATQARFEVTPVAVFPPVLEDIAVIVEEDLPAARVEEVIRQAGGRMLTAVRLFDIFRGPQIGEGKKSMAYSLTYQSAERTLTDTDAAQIRQRIVKRLAQELNAQLRS